MRIWLPSIRARSGADVYVQRLADGLGKRGAEPIVQWIHHAFQYTPWMLRRLCPPLGTDVICANSWIAFAFGKQSLPLVATTLHCVARRGYPEWKSLPQAIFHDHLVRRFESASFRTADAVVAISDSTRNEVCEDFGIRDVHTIPLWIDTNVFSPGPTCSFANSRPTRILIVGNLSRRKGGDLIGPFCNVLGPDFHVTVVAGLRGNAPKAAAEGATLRFVSGLSRDQLVGLYRDADIVVSLSRHEGFGYTALEGMACGKPVVAFRVSGLRDVVLDGATGLLVAAEDISAMANACRTLRDNPVMTEKIGASARERAVTVFSETRAIEAHLQLYSTLLARRGK